MMHHHEEVEQSTLVVSFLNSSPFLFVGALYILLVFMTNKKYKEWPINRTLFFIGALCCSWLALVGPIAQSAHLDFEAHMITHLLLGMLAPLLLVLSSPMRLVLRALPVKYARRLTTILKSDYFAMVTHPIIASILNVGGLWILYTTELYSVLHISSLFYIIVHLHVFLAGYIFTVSMIYIDPTPHRTGFLLRSIVLILAMAGHSILSKWIYANPPVGVDPIEAQNGGMLMYYGGDLIDLMIVIILCYQHFNGKGKVKKGALALKATTKEGV